jgi:hypothetical protein
VLKIPVPGPFRLYAAATQRRPTAVHKYHICGFNCAPSLSFHTTFTNVPNHVFGPFLRPLSLVNNPKARLSASVFVNFVSLCEKLGSLPVRVGPASERKNLIFSCAHPPPTRVGIRRRPATASRMNQPPQKRHFPDRRIS